MVAGGHDFDNNCPFKGTRHREPCGSCVRKDGMLNYDCLKVYILSV